MKAIAMRCKITFQYHLSNRGYHGKGSLVSIAIGNGFLRIEIYIVLFDHKNGTLNIRV
jgi:hypothetical protein